MQTSNGIRDIVKIIVGNAGVALHEEGGVLVGNCPFCNGIDKLCVSLEPQQWTCFNEECLERINGQQQWLNLFYFARRWVERREYA